MKQIIFLVLISFLGTQILQAQSVSLTANIHAFSIDNVSSEDTGTNVDYTGKFSSSGSLNLRLFSNKWAFRLGGGVDNLQYQVTGDGIESAYEVERKDIKGIIGIERHFSFPLFTIYPGIIVPITIVGDDNILNSNFDNIENGNARAELGLVLGATTKFLRIFRIGLEANYKYGKFKSEVWENYSNKEAIQLKSLNFDTALTIGIAF